MSKLELTNIGYRLVLNNISVFTKEELELIEESLVRAVARRDDTVIDGQNVTDILFTIVRHNNAKVTWVPGASLGE